MNAYAKILDAIDNVRSVKTANAAELRTDVELPARAADELAHALEALNEVARIMEAHGVPSLPAVSS